MDKRTGSTEQAGKIPGGAVHVVRRHRFKDLYLLEQERAWDWGYEDYSEELAYRRIR